MQMQCGLKAVAARGLRYDLLVKDLHQHLPA